MTRVDVRYHTAAGREAEPLSCPRVSVSAVIVRGTSFTTAVRFKRGVYVMKNLMLVTPRYHLDASVGIG